MGPSITGVGAKRRACVRFQCGLSCVTTRSASRYHRLFDSNPPFPPSLLGSAPLTLASWEDGGAEGRRLRANTYSSV